MIDPVLVYSTYLGGSSFEAGLGIAVDGLGAAYVMGQTLSTDFPTACTPAPCTVLDGSLGGPPPDVDAFVTKLNATGTALVYSTYLGGSGEDAGFGIAVDAAGAYVTGHTASTDFPTACTPAPCTVLDGSLASDDAFVTKIAEAPPAILVSDANAGTAGRGALFRVHATTGTRTLLSDFGKITQDPLGVNPAGVAVD